MTFRSYFHKLKNMSDLKSEIIRVAAKLFAEKGYDKTSTRDIASRAGANISMISYHFGGKEGLYVEVMRSFANEIQSGFLQLLDEFDRQEMNQEIFVTEMGRIVTMLIEMRKKHPEICQIFSREKIEGLPHSKKIHTEIFYPLLQKFVHVFLRAQEKGIVRTDISAPLFFTFLSEGVFGFFEMMSCDQQLRQDFSLFRTNTEQLKNQILSIYLKGVLL